ncbi:MAG: hypothetical protein WCP07_04130, partial [bacterium]
MKNQAQFVRPRRRRTTQQTSRSGRTGLVMAPDPTDAPLPFRWNIAEERRLGSLLAGERAASSADIN